MAPGDAVASSKRFHVLAVERSFINQTKRTTHYPRGTKPGRRAWRSLWPTSETGPISSRLRSRSSWKISNVFVLRTRRWTDRATVDPCGCYGNKEASVETGVPSLSCPVTCLEVQFHRPSPDCSDRTPATNEEARKLSCRCSRRSYGQPKDLAVRSTASPDEVRSLLLVNSCGGGSGSGIVEVYHGKAACDSRKRTLHL
jgi:hypothetical protein